MTGIVVPVNSLMSGHTKKHFTELSITGICTCICLECKRPAVGHTTFFHYAPDYTVCVPDGWA